MTNLKTANNPRAIIEMPWTMDECIISVMNIEADGRAYVYPKNAKGNAIRREAVTFSYKTHIDPDLPPTSVIENTCGTQYCVNFLHLTAVPRAFHNWKLKQLPPKERKKGSVRYNKDRQKWEARATCAGTRVFIGYYATEENAQRALNKYLEDDTRTTSAKGTGAKTTFGSVSYDESRGNWLARATIAGKRKTLGRFATEDDARAAVETARG